MDLRRIEQRLVELKRIITELEKELPKLPEGNLRISKKGNTVRYFHITKVADTCGRYIRKNEQELAIKLAKKDYYEKLLKEALKEKKITETYLHAMVNIDTENVYEKLSEYRRSIVHPLLMSDKEYAKWWQSEKFEGNPYFPEDKKYETKRGEFVRTKAEAMLADMYYDMGICYKYEYPIKMADGSIKYPDFALLKLSERKVIYHEHLGLLDDADYRKKNMIKFQEYMKSGYYLGDNLIITYETEYVPLNIRDVRQMIKKVLL